MFNVVKNKFLLPGMVVLKRNGKVVWTGHVTLPWEDVDCDSMEVSEQDYDNLNLSMDNKGEPRGSNSCS